LLDMNIAQPGTTRVGFIGLGLMGRPMAQRVLDAGYQLTVFNRTAEKAKPLVEAGAQQAGSAGEVAAASDVVITVVTDTPDVVQVVTGDGGLLAGAHQGLTWIDMSTISPEATRELGARVAAAGVETLDAPVSGGPPGAAAGSLAIMVGGEEHVFEASLPILRTMGSAITHMGVLGAGQVTKACNQIVLAGYLMSISEGLVFGAKAGVDPARIREALLGGYAQGRMLDVHGERMVKHAFAPGFFVRLHNKDLHIVLEMARSLATPAPIAALAAQNFNALVAEGGGELDNSSMVKVYEKLAQKELA
jgi:2-hydroxy-3-oxopropionate reductase